MKDRKTHRAVKNIIHNELGITEEKLNQLVNEYVDKKLNKRIEDFLESSYFSYIVGDKINKQLDPAIKEVVKSYFRWGLTVDVNLNKEKL